MPRRRVIAKREILPDPKFNNQVVAKFMGSLIQWGVFVPAISGPITHGCEGSKVGAIPIEEGMTQNNA